MKEQSPYIENTSDGNRRLRRANEQFQLGNYKAALELYINAIQLDVIPRKILEFNIKQCENRIARQSDSKKFNSIESTILVEKRDSANQVDHRDETTISLTKNTYASEEVTVTLTTISARLPLIRKVLESLHKQTISPKKIIVNISQTSYLLDEGISPEDPRLKELIDLPLVELNWVENTGPYRKIWSFVENHFSNTITTDKLFITVDDDTLYPDYFIETLIKKYHQHNCVVAFRGRQILISDTIIKPYSSWSVGADSVEISNLPTGKDGVLYSTKFFTKDFLDLSAALENAPTADDLWIRWHCAANGVPAIILNPDACTSDYKSFPVVDYSKDYRDVSLYATHNSTSSKGKNDLSVKALEQYYLNKFGYSIGMLIDETN